LILLKCSSSLIWVWMWERNLVNSTAAEALLTLYTIFRLFFTIVPLLDLRLSTPL
jgi:hypothetical protein